MTQDVNTQLQIWKDLAISKQILMGAATDALGLDSECTTAELKTALNQAIQRARDADIKIHEISSQTEQQIDEFGKQVKAAEQARDEAEAQVEVALKAREQAERQLVGGKADNAEALKRAKAEVTDKQNKLKAISKALADTPENVVRKLKTVKKQKMDEAKLRGKAESSLQASRKQIAKLEAEIEAHKPVLDSTDKLLKQATALHELCLKADETIKKLSDKKKDRLKIPALDESALTTLEQALAK